MFRNKEYKSIIIKVIVFQIMFVTIAFFIANIYLKKLNNTIIRRDASLIGLMLEENPESEEDVIGIVTKGPSDEELGRGREILENYGYREMMDKNNQFILRDINSDIRSLYIGLFLVSLFGTIAIVSYEYRLIYKKVRSVSEAAEEVVEGNFDYLLSEDGEGDFNILNHQFNQMANRLENTVNSLSKEKIFLKNTISDISHQIKTPLSSLIMLNDIMISDLDMDRETRLKFLEKNSLQLDRMEWLIINLLKVARIEAGAIDFKREEVYIIDIIENSIRALSINLKDFNVEIVGNRDVSMKIDGAWTEEAIINILKNASEYGREKIVINISETPLFTSISIRDDGQGIDDRDKPYVFERFYKSSNDLKPESIGIGLNLSKLIVESQEGTVSLKSKKGEGSEFIITFLKQNI